jgi:hypothetical protein
MEEKASRSVGDTLTIDDRIKHAQHEKLLAEVRQLRGVSAESLGKLAIVVLGIVAAGFTVWTGVPQTRLELANAQKDLIGLQQTLNARTLKIQELNQESERMAAEIRRAESQLMELESMRLRAQVEVANLQEQALKSQVALQRIGTATGQTLTREATEQVASAAKPRVFVQFAGAVSREDVIDPLRRHLAGLGLVVPDAERIDRGQNNEVRIFSKSAADAAVADKVAATTQAYFQSIGCPLPSLPIRHVALPNGKSSPVELWLKVRCPA